MIDLPNSIRSLFQLFISTISLESINVKEDHEQASFCVIESSMGIPSLPELSRVLASFSSRDKFCLTVIIDRGSPMTLTNVQDTENFLMLLSDHITNDNPTKVNAEIRFLVMKKIIDNSLSVYSLKAFSEYCEELSCSDLLDLLSKLSDGRDEIIFRCQENVCSFGTTKFKFLNEVSDSEGTRILTDELFAKRDTECSFLQASRWRFVPEEFSLVLRSESEEMNSLFEMLETLFSIAFISRTSSVEDDKIRFKIDGYKSANGVADFSEQSLERFAEARKIYKWVYTGGSFSDKMFLARNIISLSVRDGSLERIEERTMNSIRSGYEIYLKKNVQQYIDLKNKATDYLLEMSMKTSGIVESFASAFKNNLMLMITFFVTVVILNSISGNAEGRLRQIFSKEITILSFFLLVVSTIYLLLSIFFVLGERNRFKNSYKDLKDSYSDILDKDDINRIFCDDRRQIGDMKFINQRVIWTTIAWVAVLVSVLLMLTNVGDLCFHLKGFFHLNTVADF